MAGWRRVFFEAGRWRWGWQLGLYGLLLVISVAALVGPIAWGLMRIGGLPPLGQPLRGWPAALSLSLAQVALYTAVLGATHLAQRRLRGGRSLADLGLRLTWAGLGELALGIGLGALALAVSIGLASLAGWYRVLGPAWDFRPFSELGPAWLASFFNNVQPGLLEEVIFRGYLFAVLEARFNTRTAVAGSTVVFALAHLGSLSDDIPAWAALLSVGLVGGVLAQAYLARRALWLPIGLHFAWDWGISLLGSVGRPPATALLLATEVSGPAILQGPQGAGGGVFDLAGFALVALCVAWLAASYKAVE